MGECLEREREREILFSEKGKKGVTYKIEHARKNAWSNRRIFDFIIIFKYIMDVIKNKK